MRGRAVKVWDVNHGEFLKKKPSATSSLLQSRKLQAAQLLLNYGCPPHVRIAGVTPLDLAIAACQARKEWQNDRMAEEHSPHFKSPFQVPKSLQRLTTFAVALDFRA